MTYFLLPLLSGRSLLRVLADCSSRTLSNAVVLDGILQEYDTALGAGDCATNSDQVHLCINLDNVQVLDGNLLSAQVTRHHLALHDLGRIRASAHGTLMAMHRASTVAHRGAACVPALDRK